jgi:probable HAF family extracellular repeat protein
MIRPHFYYRSAFACLMSLGMMLHSVSTTRAEAIATFQGLGDLAGGTFFSSAFGASADGSVVVGVSSSTSGSQAFRWTSGTGMVGLGDLPGGTFDSVANGVSADGSVVVGNGRSTSGQEAFRWTSGTGMVGLGDLAGGSFLSRGYAISPNGAVVVGDSSSANGFEVFSWSSGPGMTNLGDPPGGGIGGAAHSASADGSVLVGRGSFSNGNRAFRLAGGTFVGLGDLPGGFEISEAFDVSGDGSVVVGYGSSSNGKEAFRWTSGTGMIGLGDLPGSSFESEASAISADGTLIVGYGSTAGGREAFLWTADTGMQTVASVLTNYGAILSGFTWLAEANDITVNSNTATVVGVGTSSSGTQAFRAQIPIVSASLADELLSLTPGLTSDTLALDVSETKLLYGDISRYEFDFTTDGIYDLTLDVGTPLFDAYWDAMSESFLFSEGDIRTYYAAINAGNFGNLTFDTRIRMTHENGTAINTSDAVITVVPEVSSLGLFVTACLFGTGIMATRRHSTQ